MVRTEYLVDSLEAAELDAPGDNYVQVHRAILNGEVETSIFQHPPSTVIFPPIVIGHNATLKFGCGIKEIAWLRTKDDVKFSISVQDAQGSELLFQTSLSRREHPADCAWQRHELNLSAYEGRSIALVLQTNVERSAEYAWAVWADPQIVHDVGDKQHPARRDRHPHIFLITADALPARYLGCYGHDRVKTPHLDELASQGVLFEQAWSQSCLTLGSYASMLTGLIPADHGIAREWQPFPISRANLPRTLEENGYHTVMTVSSLEMAEQSNGLAKLFHSVLPMLSNPMQDGEVTTRQFIRWFDERPDQPIFSWLHYFDVHPPTLPPPPFNSMYYADDPKDVRNTHLAEQFAKIRAVESLLILQIAMPALERGQAVAEVVELLEDTAAVFRGVSNSKPDLAEHLRNMGERGMRGLQPIEFGEWLNKQSRELETRGASRELLQWLKEIAELLEPTEKDILTWLRGVVDFRYPLAMYLSSISAFDAHVGALVSYLQQADLFDQSLIIVTAPHGEILAHREVPYQHLLVTPDTIHVPLLMKIPSVLEHRPGVRVGGLFDLIDLFPTILEMNGLRPPAELSGVSRWKEIKSGAEIPPHDSFASGFHGLVDSVCRPPFLFTRQRSDVRAETIQTLVAGAREVLYDTESGEVISAGQPAIVNSLRAALDQHLARSRTA